jgi:hypothetical protein
MAGLEEQVRTFKQEQFDKMMRVRFEVKGVQTFNTAFAESKDYTDAEMQTHDVPFAINGMKST